MSSSVHIASGNTGTPRDTVYPWGKGVCKQKTTDCCLRQSVGQKRSIRRISRKGYDVMIQGSLPRDSHVASLLRMTKKILAKTENLINLNYPKSQNFDEILTFLLGF